MASLKAYLSIIGLNVNGPQRKAGVATLISDRLDFKLEAIVRDTERHYIILKGSI